MPKFGSEQKRYLVEHLSVLMVVAGLCILLMISGALSFLNRYLYDNMMQMVPVEPSGDVVIVGIDEYSLREIGRWPWDRRVHAQIINQLHKQGARAILMDLILSEPDRAHPKSDQALTEAIANDGHVYLPVHVEQLRSGGQLIEVLPHAPFARVAKGLGHVDLELDGDGVARSVFLRSGIGQPWWPHITQALLEGEGLLSPDVYAAGEEQSFAGLANVRKYPRFIPFTGGAGTYPQVSAVDLLEGRVPDDLIKGQFVFIGATASGLGDMLPTPTAGQGELMSGVEINANIFDALRDDRLIRGMDTLPALLLSLLLALLAPLALPFVLPRWSIPLVIGSMLLTLGTCLGLMVLFDLWFPPSSALIAALVAYPLWTWRRLEYSMAYMRNALERLSEHSDLNRRLTEPAPLSRMLRMLDQVMPLRAWRLDTQGGASAVSGGEKLAPVDWRGPLARRYPFRHEGKRYELWVVWRQGLDADTYDYWIRAMLARTENRRSQQGPRFEVMEKHVERLRDEEQRQQALTRFFQVGLAQMSEGVLIADACGGVVFINPQAAYLLSLEGVGQDTLGLADIGRELEFSGERGWLELLQEVLADGRVQKECRNHRGMDLYLDMILVHAGDQPGRMLIISLKDISDVKQAMRTRTEMLDFLSHDLRSPMVSVLALIGKMRHGEQGEKLREFLDNVEHYAHRNLNIAEQFLQLARVEADEAVEMVEQDMLDVVESAIDQVQIQAQTRNIALRFNYDPDQDVWVRGNNELLERLVVNLLTNAIKYSHEGGQVEVSLAAEDGRVLCEVRDQGVGIPEGFQDRLFERFSRASNSGGGRTRGAGLGLRFVKVVTERHGGDIQVRSEPGKGSCFTLSLLRVEVSGL
ncbi:CHASE2 domain-containing protein [Alloalcanivorax mobilis]|uniref:CHASE2 domain-containing protein n=1 Tax=Alloalcanivorax mobilis TaxID=2019569 RepID=UPI000B5B3E27|nr:CHASE2 domain-containing protein [Alloalcanivorax mobilis]ASK35629.1 ATPase [Alcanivorax sp. N3-2A]|tara:strand:- start:8158 stop:10758 length:2601 start_codon:yes stop_codon:yes gene_type:complete